MATKDGRSQIWYADGNGNVAGFTESVGDIADTIISAYNEHFGTDIQIWTPEKKNLQVGDTVPDWSAYEKILQPMSKFAALYEDNKYLYGTISQEGRDRVARVNIGGSSGGGILCSEDGIVLGEYTPMLTNTDLQSIKARINNAGGNIQGVSTTYVSIAEGTQIEQWQSYVRV